MTSSELIFIVSIISGGAYFHDNGYIDAGVGIHSASFDGPEVNLGRAIFEIESGIEYDNAKVFSAIAVEYLKRK